MTDRRPIEAEYHAGREDDEAPAELSEEILKEALARHAAGVTIVSVRDGATVHATTVSSFAPVSVDPPVVLISVGGNAQVLPFLEEDATFVVNLLRDDQRRLATVYADSFPVGPSPFGPEGDPVIPDALASLRCRASSIIPVDGTRVVLGRVTDARVGEGETALVHYLRDYHAVPNG